MDINALAFALCLPGRPVSYVQIKLSQNSQFSSKFRLIQGVPADGSQAEADNPDVVMAAINGGD